MFRIFHHSTTVPIQSLGWQAGCPQSLLRLSLLSSTLGMVLEFDCARILGWEYDLVLKTFCSNELLLKHFALCSGWPCRCSSFQATWPCAVSMPHLRQRHLQSWLWALLPRFCIQLQFLSGMCGFLMAPPGNLSNTTTSPYTHTNATTHTPLF